MSQSNQRHQRRPKRPTATQRGNSWEFLIPNPNGTSAYTSRTFKDSSAGERWQLDAYAAIAEGHPVPDAAKYQNRQPSPGQPSRPAPRSTISVGDLADEWWRLNYVDEPMSSPARKTSTRTHIKVHIAPWFDARIDDISELTYDLGREFMHHLAGHDLDPTSDAPLHLVSSAKWYSVSEAALACGVHQSMVKRALAAGQLPNHHREVRNGRTVRGSLRISTGDLLAAGFALDGIGSDGRRRRALSQDYCTEILNTLRAIIRLARSRALINYDPLEAVRTSEARPVVANRKPNRERERAITWPEVQAIAGELSIHHQVVLWTQRILGLRISEAFGLCLADIIDFGDVGLVEVQRQGGRRFDRRNDYGEIEKAPSTKILKTSASYRVLGVPKPLLELMRTYVEAFHSDLSTGEVDPARRLILGMRKQDEGGQSGYRESFMSAAARHHLDYKHLGFHVVPQLLRKSISVELHCYVDITEHARSRFLGHAFRAHNGGAQMTAASYTPDMIDLQPFVTAAHGIADLITARIGDLFVVPGSFANPGATTHDTARAEHVRRVLSDAGWTRHRPGVSVEDAAEVLGVTPNNLHRRINRGLIDVDDVLGAAGERRRTIGDQALQELMENCDDLHREARGRAARVPPDVMTIGRLADRLGVSYATVYQWSQSGRIEVSNDPSYNVLVIAASDVQRELADAARVVELHNRSVTVAEAGEQIGCGHSMIYHWIRSGRLDQDPEKDQNGVAFVTRSSVERVAAERHEEQRRRPDQPAPPDDLIGLAQAQQLTGETRRGIQRLVAKGQLVRRDHRKRFHVERHSLETYLAERERT